MGLSSFLMPGSMIIGLKANNKKQLLQDLAGPASRLSGLDERVVFEALLQRERLGSTGIGQGVAVPHGRLAGLAHLTGLFARLARPIAFDAVDGEPVDLIFVLLAPEAAGADHLQALSRIARLFRSGNVAQKLRQTDDVTALYAILTADASPRAA